MTCVMLAPAALDHCGHGAAATLANSWCHPAGAVRPAHQVGGKNSDALRWGRLRVRRGRQHGGGASGAVVSLSLPKTPE